MKPLNCLILFLISFKLAAFDEEQESCENQAISQAAMNKCAAAKSKHAKDTLTKLLKQLEEQLPEEPQAYLLGSQQAWETVVTNDCKIKSWYLKGGSARSMIVSNCYEQHTRQRIRNLSLLLCHPMKLECEARKQYESFF